MKNIHFVGIGGIGMSALAQYFADQGVVVTGSDREASPVTELLEKKGIKVLIGHATANVPERLDALVYTDATTSDNPERVVARERGVREYSYFEMLGAVSKNKKTIAISGTHGKTTTTGMVAKILADAGEAPTAIVGSIVKDFGSNYLHGDSDILVVEADEYKAHLLHLSPLVLVITNLEWDHTDFYPSLEALQETFKKAIESVPPEGVIVTNPKATTIAPLLAHARARVVDYTEEPRYEIRLIGEFNQMNARAAAAAARAVLPSLPLETIHTALSSFHGTWRRFEYKGKNKNGADVYDDYAHHPTAVQVTLTALRQKVREVTPRQRIVVAFHPHLYSRTKDLLDQFAVAFVDADQVLVAPIYPAREEDDGSISSAILAERIRAAGTDAEAKTFDEIEAELATYGNDTTIITMGAGDIYKVADELVKP